MALAQTKRNVNSGLFRPHYSELSDEIRAKNKWEDRLLDVRLKYYEREKNIRLNILRKQQYQLERTRSSIFAELNKIQQEKQKQLIPSYIAEKIKLESSILQLSAPELFNIDWKPSSNLIQSELIPSIPIDKPITPANVIRPHSAG